MKDLNLHNIRNSRHIHKSNRQSRTGREISNSSKALQTWAATRSTAATAAIATVVLSVTSQALPWQPAAIAAAAAKTTTAGSRVASSAGAEARAAWTGVPEAGATPLGGICHQARFLVGGLDIIPRIRPTHHPVLQPWVMSLHI
jgi:hypothetical protein